MCGTVNHKRRLRLSSSAIMMTVVGCRAVFLVLYMVVRHLRCCLLYGSEGECQW